MLENEKARHRQAMDLTESVMRTDLARLHDLLLDAEAGEQKIDPDLTFEKYDLNGAKN